MILTAKMLRYVWRAANPGRDPAELDREFSAWMQGYKADAWDAGADHQARRDGELPDLSANPWRV